MKRLLTVAVLAALTLQAAAQQQKTEVKTFRLAGPYAVAEPFAADSVDVQGKKFDVKSSLSALPLQAEAQGVFSGSVLPSLKDSRSVGVLTFFVNNAD